MHPCPTRFRTPLRFLTLALLAALRLPATESYPQGPAQDVTAEFRASEGFRVTRITSTATGNQLSYYDITCYAPQADRLIFNTVIKVLKGPKSKGGGDDEEDNDGAEPIAGGYPKSAVWGVASIRPDGTDSRLLLTRVPPSTSSIRVDLSADGRLVTYARLNDAPAQGWDLYGFLVGDGVNVQEFRITHLDTPAAQTAKIKTSPATRDARTGKYVCLFTIDDRMLVVHHDGTSPRGGPGPATITLTDLDQHPERRERDTSFHRARLNPVYPNLVYYRRNGIRDNWVIDWTAAEPRSVLFNDTTLSVHSGWTPDGLKVAGKEGPRGSGAWIERTVADRTGRLLPNAGHRTVEKKTVGPFGQGDARYPGIFYASYSPDGSLLAVATDYRSDPGGFIWLLDARTGTPRLVCQARYVGPVTQGQPRLGWIRGNEALAFSTDNSVGLKESHPPQIYVVTGTNGSLPTPDHR